MFIFYLTCLLLLKVFDVHELFILYFTNYFFVIHLPINSGNLVVQYKIAKLFPDIYVHLIYLLMRINDAVVLGFVI